MEQNFVVWAHGVCNWTWTVCKIDGEDFDTLVKFDLMFHSTENNGSHFYSDAANGEKWFKTPKGQIQYLVPLVVLRLPLRNLLKYMEVGVRQTKKTGKIKMKW